MFSTKNLDSRQQSILQSIEFILGGKSIGSGNSFSNMTKRGKSIVLGCGSIKARNRVVLIDTVSDERNVDWQSVILRKDAESCVCSLVYRGFGVTFTDDKLLSYEPRAYSMELNSDVHSLTQLIVDAPFSEVHIEEHYFNAQLENPGIYKKDHIRMIAAMVPAMQRVISFRSRMFHHVRNKSLFKIEK